jgi:hypothetical protein
MILFVIPSIFCLLTIQRKIAVLTKVDNCKLLQHDIVSVQIWRLVNGMKLNLGKTTNLSLTRKTNSIYFK